MALPKVSPPTYELTIPSSGEKVSYRPFLVKEEKTLLMAMESKDTKAMTKAMQDIIASCTDGEVDPKELAPYDLEFFFLQLRGRSIGEIIEVKSPRPPNFTNCCKEAEEGDVCELSINIDDIKVDTSKIKPSNIEITKTIGIKMMFPQMDTVQKYQIEGHIMDSGDVFKLITDCVDYIWDGDDIFKAKDHSKKELNDFIDSLSSGQFEKIRDFFESMPRLSHDVDWKCPRCEKSKTLVLTGVDSFFG